MNESIYQFTSAIVLAGGMGTRFKGRKQFYNLAGKEMWKYPYDEVNNLIGKERIVVVGIDVLGGKTRTQSVINGLTAVPQDTKRVIIIEAARPLVTSEQIDLLIKDQSPSSTFVRPLVNTVVYRDARYIDRDKLYELLTPQAFDYQLLMKALNSNRFYNMTDETRIMFEFFGIVPHFIESTDNLMKVTYPQDITYIEMLLEKQKIERM